MKGHHLGIAEAGGGELVEQVPAGDAIHEAAVLGIHGVAVEFGFHQQFGAFAGGTVAGLHDAVVLAVGEGHGAEQDAAGHQHTAHLEQGRFEVVHMLEDFVADHCIEAGVSEAEGAEVFVVQLVVERVFGVGKVFAALEATGEARQPGGEGGHHFGQVEAQLREGGQAAALHQLTQGEQHGALAGDDAFMAEGFAVIAVAEAQVGGGDGGVGEGVEDAVQGDQAQGIPHAGGEATALAFEQAGEFLKATKPLAFDPHQPLAGEGGWYRSHHHSVFVLAMGVKLAVPRGWDALAVVEVQMNDAEALRLELEEARDEAELNLLQLQQVQEELEFYFLAYQEQQAQLQRYAEESRRAEGLIAALLEQLETRG